jgi:protein SCO1/2
MPTSMPALASSVFAFAAAAALGVAGAVSPSSARGEDAAAAGLDASAAWRSSQAAIGRRIGDFTLLDRRGEPVRLASYRGKPLLVSFIYTGCFQVCPANTRALHDAVRTLQKQYGEHRFNVVSIGFDQPADTPRAMKAFAAQHGLGLPDWDFLSPPAAIVAALTAEFGFRAQATPSGFDHVLQLSVVDGAGRLVHQFYGDRPASAALADVMQRLFDGTPLPEPSPLAALIDRVKLLCTYYDPVTGATRVDYSLAIEMAGGATCALAMLLYMLNEWRLRRRTRGGR